MARTQCLSQECRQARSFVRIALRLQVEARREVIQMSDVGPEKPIPVGTDLTREVLVRLRDRPYNGHPDGICYECPFASAPLDSAGRVESWDRISNDPTEAYFRCFLPSRDSSVVAWGEYAPCEEKDWYSAGLLGLLGTVPIV